MRNSSSKPKKKLTRKEFTVGVHELKKTITSKFKLKQTEQQTIFNVAVKKSHFQHLYDF